MHRYARLSPLIVEENHFESWKDLKEGDCIISYSKSKLFEYRKKINDYYNTDENGNVVSNDNHCAMIYGRMSADLKEHQSNEFNNRAGKIKILIATNAIGMGINLNIDRVIFSTITDIGGSKRRMTHSHQLMDHEIL